MRSDVEPLKVLVLLLSLSSWHWHQPEILSLSQKLFSFCFIFLLFFFLSFLFSSSVGRIRAPAFKGSGVCIRVHFAYDFFHSLQFYFSTECKWPELICRICGNLFFDQPVDRIDSGAAWRGWPRLQGQLLLGDGRREKRRKKKPHTAKAANVQGQRYFLSFSLSFLSFSNGIFFSHSPFSSIQAFAIELRKREARTPPGSVFHFQFLRLLFLPTLLQRSRDLDEFSCRTAGVGFVHLLFFVFSVLCLRRTGGKLDGWKGKHHTHCSHTQTQTRRRRRRGQWTLDSLGVVDPLLHWPWRALTIGTLTRRHDVRTLHTHTHTKTHPRKSKRKKEENK